MDRDKDEDKEDINGDGDDFCEPSEDLIRAFYGGFSPLTHEEKRDQNEA
jgi:hypothetical protein